MSDELLETIAKYVSEERIDSEEAYRTARLCLMDSLACALLALEFEAPKKLLGPLLPGTIVPNGCHVIGTDFVLDPVQAAFNNGLLIRWLDYNDTWLAAEWGHPSDNLGGILPVAELRGALVREVLTAMIQAYEIQGILALSNSMNRIGYDHVFFVKIATAAVATKLMGGGYEEILAALSQAFLDVGPLRAYRHFPNVGSRKSWAAGDATSRGVFLAWLTMRGEKGSPHPLTTKKWGFYDVVKPFTLERPLGSYVMENILFKVSFPAEFHAQTAVEAAIQLHNKIKDRIEEIDEIRIETQEAAVRIIDKTGPLKNPADRDHCIQYMVAVALLKGNLTAEDYEIEDPQVETLREKMVVLEDKTFTKNYLDPEKRSIGNRIAIRMKNREEIGPVTVEYPIGHKRRREEAMPLLYQKCRLISRLFQNPEELDQMPIKKLMRHTLLIAPRSRH